MSNSKYLADRAIEFVIREQQLNRQLLILEDEKGSASKEPDALYMGAGIVAIEHTQYFQTDRIEFDKTRWDNQIRVNAIKRIEKNIRPALINAQFSLGLQFNPNCEYLIYDYIDARKPKGGGLDKDKETLRKSIASWNNKVVDIVSAELLDWIPRIVNWQDAWTQKKPLPRNKKWLLPKHVEKGMLVEDAYKDDQDYLDTMWSSWQPPYGGYVSPNLIYTAYPKPNAISPGDVLENMTIAWAAQLPEDRLSEIIAGKDIKVDGYIQFLKGSYGIEPIEKWLVIDISDPWAQVFIMDSNNNSFVEYTIQRNTFFDKIFIVDSVRGHFHRFK